MPRSYTASFTSVPPRLDGILSGPGWDSAPWSEPFVDIEGDKKPLPRYRTRVKMLWDAETLYIGAEMEEPHLWATLTERDCVIFQDNDFEVFLDPDGDAMRYFELEVNALGTAWDLYLEKPYRDGGSADNSWDITGLQVGVSLEGTLNDPRDTDRGWTLALAIPFSDLRLRTPDLQNPQPGDTWRINFSRVQWDLEVADGSYRKIPNRPEHNWVWSPQGVIDMHQPEHWGFLRFA